MQKLIQLLLSLFFKKKPIAPIQPPIITPPEPQIAPEEEVKPEVLLWDTPERARHSARVIMDEYGLTWEDKNEICATIMGESGFKIHAKNENKRNGVTVSTDWGICQINDYYHIGKGKSFASVDEVMNFPEKSIVFIIKQFKAGNIDWWIAHRNGSYKKYL